MSKVTCVYFSLHKNIFVLKKGTRKMNKLKELRNKVKKNNKGFSLVELIVVIVILAILIGVTIGGIYQYVNKSRVNTDINNASSITSALSVLSTNKDLVGDAFKDATYTLTWKDKCNINSISGVITKSDTAKTAVTPEVTAGKTIDTAAIGKEMGKILTYELPKSQSDNEFTLEISWDEKGNMQTIKCTTAAEPQE